MAVLILWSLGAAAGWWWLRRTLPPGFQGCAPVGKWHGGDIVCAGLVAGMILLTVLAGEGEAVTITPDLIQGGISFYAIVAGMFVVLAFRPGQSLSTAFGLRPPHPLRTAGMGVLGLVLTFPFVLLAVDLAARIGPSPSEGDGMVQFLRGPLSASDIAWASALVVVVAPVTEELVFRGYLYGVIRKYAGQLGALLTSALLFAALHNNLPAMPALFLLGLGLALVYEITGSLWAPILMHALFNLTQLLGLLVFPEWMPQK